MRVVSNTSPLSNLAIVGRLDFLQRRYSSVQIPPAVAKELTEDAELHRYLKGEPNFCETAWRLWDFA